MDCWNPNTFDNELQGVFIRHSNLIANYFREDRRLMDEHLHSDPYESLKPNKYSRAYHDLLENVLTPMFVGRSIRVWHYTKLLDDEVEVMKQQVIPSTLSGLSHRITALVKKKLLTPVESDLIFQESPFHKQEEIRANIFWSVTVPVSPEHHGVKPLLEIWGGESAYFWLSDNVILQKLKKIGLSRIVEIETQLTDRLDAYSVARTASMAWAASLDIPLKIEGTDLAITDCIKSARVLRIHTIGDDIFNDVAEIYPDGCDKLLKGY